MLQCLIVALKAEAQPLINYYKLDKDFSFDYPVYNGRGITLVCTGVGRENIRKKLTDFYYRIVHLQYFQIINIGIAGGVKGNCSIGQCFIINSVADDTSDVIYKLNNIFETKFLYQNITTVTEPVVDGGNAYTSLVDMESHEICSVINNFNGMKDLLIIKIISDFMDVGRDYFSFETVHALIENNVPHIDRLLMDFRSDQ
jgi:nucleoside phosphorylase|tara:strand:+ start:62 stop:661 length:600 start_codon:yes stop_codon:yes gene_type:complete